MGEGLSVRDGTAIVEARAPVGLDLINLYIAGSLKPKLGGNHTLVQQVGCWGCQGTFVAHVLLLTLCSAGQALHGGRHWGPPPGTIDTYSTLFPVSAWRFNSPAAA